MRSLISRMAILAALVGSVQGAEIRQKEVRHPDGKIKQQYAYYLDEKGREVKTGLDEEFHPDGTLKGSITWNDGLEDGPAVFYYPNGRKSYEANYRQGKKNGFATVWYDNGQKQWQTTFQAGKTNGRWREWYPDGKKKFEANYRDGKLDGLATWWYQNGHIQQERNYQAGNQVPGSVKEWDSAGRQTYPPLPGEPSQKEGISATVTDPDGKGER